MKRYRQLQISGNPDLLRQFIVELKQLDNPPFKYQSKLSEDYARNIFHDIADVVVLKTERVSLFEATVWLYRNNDKIILANITYRETVDMARYNTVLSKFFDVVIEPIAHQQQFEGRIRVSLTPDHIEPKDLMCQQSYKLLLEWIETCNIDSPIAHFIDYTHWMNFIISLHDNSDSFTPADLRQWLYEDRSWPEEWESKVDELTTTLEFGKDILDQYADLHN